MKHITQENKKAQLLRNSVDSDHYNSLAAYLDPAKPIKDSSYAKLVENFNAFLSPKKKWYGFSALLFK